MTSPCTIYLLHAANDNRKTCIKNNPWRSQSMGYDLCRWVVWRDDEEGKILMSFAVLCPYIASAIPSKVGSRTSNF